MFEKEAEEKYCKGCKLRIEQCLWAWRNTNGLNEPNEKNCSCIKVPAYIAGAEFGYNKAKEEAMMKLKGVNMFEKEAEDCEEQPKYCHDCAKFDEMPKGPRCKTCDNGSHFQKKEEA